MYLAAVLLLTAAAESRLPLKPGWVETRSIESTYATQAAGADGESVFAASNTHVARYDRRTGRLLDAGTGPGTKHLNSVFVWKGSVYCAHSNYPNKPEESDVRVYESRADGTGRLRVVHSFANPPGSLVWCLFDGTHWWCCFAQYGKDNARTLLAKMDRDFREHRRWTFPKVVVDDWDGMSASGGVWDGDTLLVSHHHFKVLYRLKVPKNSPELEFVEALQSPFPGQGIASDPRGGLVGIDRGRKRIVLAEKAAGR